MADSPADYWGTGPGTESHLTHASHDTLTLP